MPSHAFPLLSCLMAGALAAQTPAEPISLKWKGAMWASAAISDKETTNGSLFMRPMDAGNGQLSLDGMQVGLEVALPSQWSVKTTILGGHYAKGFNEMVGESGAVALPEMMLIWTGSQDTLRFGRMFTWLGMEYLDQGQNLACTRGLLFHFAIPGAQTGLNWHHTFSPSWSSELWVINGEDKMKDNNRGKTAGIGLNYNHGGAPERFVSFGVFHGPEQTSIGPGAEPGAEGRPRQRIFLNGQWVWGSVTLQFEAEGARERFRAEALGGTPGSPDVDAHWSGIGAIAKWQFARTWALAARFEQVKDNTGVRVAWDPVLASLVPKPQDSPQVGKQDLDLVLTCAGIGLERTWDKVFSRLEVRLDRSNKEVVGKDDKRFQQALSATWSLGTSF